MEREDETNLLFVLRRAASLAREICEGQHPDNECWNTLRLIRARIALEMNGE